MISINDCLPLVRPLAGCDFHRVELPFLALGFSKINDNLRSACESAKLITYNRYPCVNDVELLYQYRKEFGVKLVVDMDDHWKLPSTHPLYKWWTDNKLADVYESLILNADAVTCSTERLAKKIREINTNCYVIPNAVPFNQQNNQWVCNENRKYGSSDDIPHTRFGWAGGDTHLRDLQTIKKVFKKFPRLDFSLCGYNKNTKKVWYEMESIVNYKKSPFYKRVYTKSLWEYMTHLDEIDVAIAPLEDIEWNTYKSSLKAYEAGGKKCAFICSNVAPYTDDVPNDCATFCSNTEEWIAAFKMHQDLDFVKIQADKLHEWVKKYRNLGVVSQYRLSVYDHIVNGGNPLTLPTYDSLVKNQFKISTGTPQKLKIA